jgi:hypothetical protein
MWAGRFNRTEPVPDGRSAHRTRQVPRERADLDSNRLPRIVTDDVFEAAGRVPVDNTQWSPRRRAETRTVAAEMSGQMRARHQLPQDASP